MRQYIRYAIGTALVLLPAIPVKVMAQEEAPADSAASQLVPVAFKQVAKEDLMTGEGVVDYKELTRKNYNTYSIDNMQAYVPGFTGSSWASGDYLVLVDGVPRDASNILPTEIDQITFLNSAASVALYGSTAAKGVVLITTKKGNMGSLRINARANYQVNTAKRYPKYLGSAEYMTLYNEALANDGLDALYTDDEIYNYASGTNPYRYPDVDFYSSDYIRKVYTQANANVDISGGSDRARYFVNVNYYRIGDVFKFGEAKHNYTDRLAFRGNIDININSWISAFVHSNVSFYNSKGPNSSTNYWSEAATMRPNRVSPLVPTSYLSDGDTESETLLANTNLYGGYFLAGTQTDQTNVFADYYAGGKSTYTSRQFQFDTGVKFDLNRFVKGLSFQTQFAVDYNTSYTTYYSNTYSTYEPSWADYNGSDVITSLTKYSNDAKSGVQNVSGSYNKQTVLFRFQFNYERQLGDDHHLSAMLLGNGYQQSWAGAYHRTSNVNLGMELAYNFRQRYYAQFDGAVVHSAKLAPGHREAFSPSLTLGWKLKNEPWMQAVDAVDELTLSASVSQLHQDIDISDYYLYEGNYTQADGAWWGWREGITLQSTLALRGGNEDLTFIKRNEVSAHLKGAFFNRMLELQADFWTYTMDGGIIQSSTLYPNYFTLGWPTTSFVPYVNYEKDRRTGFDLGVKFNKTFGQVQTQLGVNATWYSTEAVRRDENYEYSYQNREGRPLDAIFGLLSDGFYESEEDIANSPTSSFGDVQPGDIKYKDVNGDGVINSNDEVYLGKGGWYGSPFTLGINLTLKWKDFTFFALCTGGYGAKGVKNTSYDWVYGDGKYSEVVRGRWTEETAATATYPRLTTLSSDNNFRTSDFWLYSTDRFDLQKVQITYDLPTRWFTGKVVRGMQVYVSGSSLLTIAGERKYMELSIGSSPQYRTYNLGVYVNL